MLRSIAAGSVEYLVGDGYSWRKYGQKKILVAKYPRLDFLYFQTPIPNVCSSLLVSQIKTYYSFHMQWIGLVIQVLCSLRLISQKDSWLENYA
jgi:hypothetical protein